MYWGEIMSLASALSWSIGTICLKECTERFHPVVLIFIECVLALMFVTPLLFFFHIDMNMLIENSQQLVPIVVSAFCGIFLGGIFHFVALSKLGASVSAVFDCVYIPFVLIIAAVFLSEMLSGLQIFGAGLVVTALLIVWRFHRSENFSKISEGPPQATEPPALAAPDRHRGWAESLSGGFRLFSTYNLSGLAGNRREFVQGAGAAVLSQALYAVSAVVMKPIITKFPVVGIAHLRLILASIFAAGLLAFWRSRRIDFKPFFDPRNMLLVTLGALFCTTLSTLFWVESLRHTMAAKSAVLVQMSTIFTVVLSAIFLGEKLSWAKISAVFIAITGVLLVV